MIAAEPLAGAAIRYRLALWTHGHAIRRIERYDEDSERGRVAEKAARSTEKDRRLLAILFSPILGHLPGSVQKTIEHDGGVSAVAMTIVSALPLFAVSAASLIVGQASALAGVEVWSFGIFRYPLVSAYFSLESSLRIASAILMHEPMGSALGCLGWEAWKAIRPQPARAVPAGPPRLPAPPERQLEDRFKMIEPFLSFLSAADQAVLERRFDFDRWKWGRRMALLVLAAAGANVGISLLAMLSRTALVLDYALLVVCGYLVLEQIRRLRALGDGQPSESVLGFFVRPFARPLLAAAVKPTR